MLSIDELFKGRHFDREIIILCVRWYTPFTRQPENPWVI
jgi:transposase-like protein